MTTVGEPRADFSQIGHPDGLAAQHTERIRARRSAVHQDESHVAPGAAGLKFLHHLPQARLRNLKSKAVFASALSAFEVRDRGCPRCITNFENRSLVMRLEIETTICGRAPGDP
jgi:hypothetical protein